MKKPIASQKLDLKRKHGFVLKDEYGWLRERKNPKVIAYLKAENAYTKHVLKPTERLQKSLFREILSRIQETDMSVPAKDGLYYYYSRTKKGKQYPIFCRKYLTEKAPEQILLNLNWLARGHSYFHLGLFEVSPDGNLLAYSTDTNGSEAYTLYFKDLRSGKFLRENISNTAASGAWSEDQRFFFYTVLDKAKRPHQLWRHELGEPVSQDQLVYHEKDEKFLVSISKTKDRKYLILDVSSKVSSELYYLDARRPKETFHLIQKRKEKLEYSAEHYEGRFFILHNANAKNFELAIAPISEPAQKNWKVFIKHSPKTKLEDIDVCKDYLIVYERSQGLMQVRTIHLPTQKTIYVPFKDPVYSVWDEDNFEFQAQKLRLNYTSLATPHTVFDYDLKTGAIEIKKKQKVLGGFNEKKYVTERLYAESHDGVKVPISLVYRRGLKRNGSNPCLLYGYGSYGHSIEPSFASSRLSLLDRGFVYAIAHIRGGADLGETWYEQGKFLKKKNTFLDFIACARCLIKKGFTSPKQLMISGGSAGGMLMGAVLNAKPELFAGALMHVPFVDVLNTMLDPSLPLTVTEYDEWGNPAKKNYFHYIRSYSPYDNIKRQTYPPILVTAGLHDPRVQYWEPAKWVARLRRIKTDSHVLLLKTDMGAGHMGASGRYDAIKEIALDYGFLFFILGIKR